MQRSAARSARGAAGAIGRLRATLLARRAYASSSAPVEVLRVPAASLGLEEFRQRFVQPKLPCILTGGIDGWPALERWRDPSYFVRLFGDETVPVEVGGTYLDPQMRKESMTMAAFVERHLRGGAKETGYLAQHQLFGQVPALREDIEVPGFVAAGRGDMHQVSAWIGPINTVSPLHRDPYENLLCQVVGCKRVVLYPPSQEPLLYPFRQLNLRNSSQVDVEKPDLDRFPLFAEAKGVTCEVHAGEMLYLPLRYWHYIRSVPVEGAGYSATVTFWWM
eukprot:tig00020710_g13379.t1